MNPKQGLTVFLFILTLASCQDWDPIESYSTARNDSSRNTSQQLASDSTATNDFSTNTSQEVVLYATSWCGYCRKAREFLDRNQIDYVEYDIEKSVEGRRQFAELRGSGVPLLLVGSQEVRGWNPKALKAALARARPTPSRGTPAAIGVDKGSTSTTPADDAYQGMSAVSFITPSTTREHRYIIHLSDLRQIRVDDYWEAGDEIKYEKFGGIIGVPRKDVVKIEDTDDGTTKRYTQR